MFVFAIFQKSRDAAKTTARPFVLRSDALHILAGAGIDADLVALVDEQGDTDLGTGLNGGGLQGVGGGVALDTRLGSGDFQLNKVGDLNAENLALVAQQLAGVILLAELEVSGTSAAPTGISS